MAKDPELSAHLEWLGYIQPVGLVVSPPALLQAQAHINRNVIPQHQRFLGCLPVGDDEEPVPQITDFPAFVRSVLDWQDSDLIPFEQAAENGIDVTGLEVVLPEYNETLRPTWIVPEVRSSRAATAVNTDPFSSAGKQTDSLFNVSDADGEQDDALADGATISSTADQPEPANADRIVMLITQVAVDQDLDAPLEESDRRWHASPHAKFERLLREAQVPAGLLTNGRNIRLVYAPRGETSGYLTFHVEEMTTVAGRPIFAALHMLLNSDRLFNLEKRQRLPAILAESRKYQNTVSTQLAQQVMAALYELLRGFQAADDQWNGRLLKDVLAKDPQHVYHGLLTVLMRTVFILYAEDRNLLSNHPVYTNYYSIIGLFERLRSDAGQYPDTMDQRYGAWAQLLTLFRMIYEGGSHDDLKIPPRKGYLFDPERYPFLEGFRASGLGHGDKSPSPQTPTPSPQTPIPNPQTPIPRVPDGVIYRVLNNLLMLEGERLSYRSLDVEQIGSVYEAIMGFEVKVSTGRSIAIKPVKKHGAPATINLEDLLQQKVADRAKWLKERTDQDFSGQSADALRSAKTIEDLLAALGKRIATEVTPNLVPGGAMIFQPSDERRRSGSHYTPRSLTEPIVRKTLEPILKSLCDGDGDSGLGDGAHSGDDSPNPKPQTLNPNKVWQPTAADKRRYTAGEIAERIRLSKIAVENAKLAREKGVPHPAQILDLKICDPAMGSGAFLVEACRQLGDALIKSWAAHSETLNPKPQTLIPPDEDEVLYARRLIAQRCLYGVDKNDMAVDLAKLSLWLVTLAKDHAFTFLDHSLRHGDALVGLTREQIIGFHWEPKKQKQFGEELIQKRLDRATEARAKILNAREDVPYRDQEQRLAMADEALNVVRLTGDACVSAFFAGSKKKDREDRCEELFASVSDWYASGHDISKRGPIAAAAASLRSGSHPLPPFHWEIEFPEVFSRENGGFDVFVGNPPFLGAKGIRSSFSGTYLEWLSETHSDAKGQVDLVAYFFRRTFGLLHRSGTFGLIATRTIARGDTRQASLMWIRANGGSIYSAIRRIVWPGVAAVHISVLHVSKSVCPPTPLLDGKPVNTITSYLFESGPESPPEKLKANAGLSFPGFYNYGEGFTFADGKADATPTSEMYELFTRNPKNRERVFEFLGGDDILNSPGVVPSRYVIDFADMSLEDAEQWPDLIRIVKEKVYPQRQKQNRARRKDFWWQFGEISPGLRLALADHNRVLAHPYTSKYSTLVFVPSSTYVASPNYVLIFDQDFAFAVLQSQIHESWALFFGGDRKDWLVYTASDCFETYPFPSCDTSRLDNIGNQYYRCRDEYSRTFNIGLTDYHNRFHDPHEQSSEILHLRELHAAMDRAVLEAYGWHDLAATARCEFLLDYEEEGDRDLGSGFGEDSQSPTPKPQSRRRKPYRLRWPDDFRDEVLARLLELNEQRHKEELLAGKAGVGCRVSGAGDENGDDEEFTTDDEDVDAPRSQKQAKTSAAKPKAPRKSKKAPATGQQKMDFS